MAMDLLQTGSRTQRHKAGVVHAAFTRKHDAVLQVFALECIRGDRLLFSDLAFTARAGQVIQVQGPNGCGKTSLLRILSGLTPPAQGEVLWYGKTIHRAGSDYLAQINFIGHANGIKADLTPLENLHMAVMLGTASSHTDKITVLQRLGLEKYFDIPCRQLSAGQQRRVALARLLVTQASIWILDEPFTSLDSHGIEMVENMLLEHTDKGGLVLLTSHHQLDICSSILNTVDLVGK